jgi:membrane glycosyltransferase
MSDFKVSTASYDIKHLCTDIMRYISSKMWTHVCQKAPGRKMIIKTTEKMFFGQMRQNYNFLDEMGPIISGENQTLHSTVRTSYQRSSMVVVV